MDNSAQAECRPADAQCCQLSANLVQARTLEGEERIFCAFGAENVYWYLLFPKNYKICQTTHKP